MNIITIVTIFNIVITITISLFYCYKKNIAILKKTTLDIVNINISGIDAALQ